MKRILSIPAKAATKRCTLRHLAWRTGLAGLFMMTPLAHGAEDFAAGVRRDTEWLTTFPSRVPGTAGHKMASDELLDKLRQMPGLDLWTQEFQVIVPVVKRAEMTVSYGPWAGRHAIYPLWPDLVRVNTTPAEGIGGHLRYVGSGTIEAMPARSLRGEIAVMEMSHYENWKTPFLFGAAAVVLLGGTQDQALPPSPQPLHFPRYYVPQGDFADALRQGAVTQAVLFCEAAWEPVIARNLYALVKPAPGSPSLPAVALAAPYDSMSLVMGLAPGADQAVDAAFLLNLLNQMTSVPPARAVLFGFLDAYGINQLGMRQMLAMLTLTQDDPVRKVYAGMQQERLVEYKALAGQSKLLGGGREALDQLWDKQHFRELQRCIKDAVGPEALGLQEEISRLLVALHGADEAGRPAIRRQLDTKRARLGEINLILEQMLTRAPVTELQLPESAAIWNAVQSRIDRQLTETLDKGRYFESLDRTRQGILRALGKTGDAIPVAFMLGFDLSDAGISVGPSLTCSHLGTSDATPAREFLRWLNGRFAPASSLGGWRENTEAWKRVLNSDPASGRESVGSFVVGPVALPTSPAPSFRLPAVTWATLEGRRERVDTPRDLANLLDWQRLTPQIDATRRVVESLLSDPSFPSPRPLSAPAPRWRMVSGVVVGESLSGTVPSRPMNGYLVTLTGEGSPGPVGAAGVRRHEFALTGVDGQFEFPPLPGAVSPPFARLQANAFKLADDGRITGARSDRTSMVVGKLSSSVRLDGPPARTTARLLAFECAELAGSEFFDPRFLEPLSNYTLFDTLRGGAPKFAQFSINGGQMAGLLVPGTRWQLLLRAGTAGNRMMLMNLAPGLEDGSLSLRDALRGGFPMAEPLPSLPAHIAAQDMFRVDEWRLRRLARAGISVSPLETVHHGTAALLKQADDAVKRDDGGDLQRLSIMALAQETRAYEAIRALGDDVTRGAIFLMILLVPFAVAMERLLFACARIGRCLTVVFLLFVVMTLLLWSFHPAYRITTQPLVIVLAFAILLLSLFVISIVLRKFEADLEAMRSGRAEGSGAQTGRKGVIGSAIWLGIANMRKRKLRTVLTGTTIALITFALLCFASTTQYEDKREFALRGKTAASPGVLLHQPNTRPMSERAVQIVRGLLDGTAACVPRYWWISQDPMWRLHVRNPLSGHQVSLKGALGLVPGEGAVTHPERFVSDWNRFGDNTCILAEPVAAELKVRIGDPIVVAGSTLTLAGTFDPDRLDLEWRSLDGQSLSPFDLGMAGDDEPFASPQLTDVAATVSAEGEKEGPRISGRDLIILPASLVRSAGGTLRSIGIQPKSSALPSEIARNLARVLALPIYYADDRAAVNVIVATPLAPRFPRNLWVPLLMAALIVFNTMLNSVAERKGEIHIYSSLGLAPSHVGMLFVAEALTYGLLGSLFGYVAGQGLATVLTRYDLMGGVVLNYSGTNAILTMGMVLIVVALSAIVPAVMAGRLAAPGESVSWRLPPPTGGVIRDILPFMVTRETAPGLMAFIHEYLDAHKEGALGHFAADAIRVLPPEGDRVAGLEATVWVEPYDLGVRQTLRLEVKPRLENMCGVHMELAHRSGPTGTWQRLNRSFVAELRRQFLGWRRVPPDRVIQYITESRA